MQFGHPEWLHALWGVPLLAWLLLALLRRRERQLTRLVAQNLWPVMTPERSPQRQRWRLVLWLAATALLMVALARPQWGFRWEDVKRRGLDILVVLDTSRSMSAQDLKPNRLQRAKWGVRDLVGKLHGDRIGLIAFAGSSYAACPLTIDYPAFAAMLEDVYVGFVPRGGTAIAQALETAVRSFEAGGSADRAIVLVTDGDDLEGDPLALIPELKEKNIRVYAVGIGSPEGELIPDEAEGRAGFFKDRQGNVVKTALHEDVLRRLAVDTGGAYVRATPGDFGLERIYDLGIAQLKRAEQAGRLSKIFEERYPWFVGGALLLLLGEALIAPRKRTREVAT
ncbi:MAG: VWA domain-containing protein [Verrucomicrobia bacterium]|nr:MAG: VWA domain-containing protein [Verrucomicrobiota bacterium]